MAKARLKPGTVGALMEALAKFDSDKVIVGYPMHDEELQPLSEAVDDNEHRVALYFSPPRKIRFRVACDRRIRVAREVSGKLKYAYE